MQKMIVLFGRPTSVGVQSEGRQVSLYGLQLHVKQLKWNHRSPTWGWGEFERGGEKVRKKHKEKKSSKPRREDDEKLLLGDKIYTNKTQTKV